MPDANPPDQESLHFMTRLSNGSVSPPRADSRALRYDLLLPHKEKFSATNAGAVASVVTDLVRASQTYDRFRVIGTPVDAPFDDIEFCPLPVRRRWLHGGNIGFAEAYLNMLRGQAAPDLVEVHGRCQVAAHIKAKRPDLRVALYLHNDPRDMKGGNTVAARATLLAKLSAIICVSDYIKDCFLDGLEKHGALASKVHTARNGVDRTLAKPTKKTPTILFVGRMVAEKGVLELAEAASRILPQHPEWRICLVGAKGFEVTGKSSYEQRVATALEPLGPQAQMTGFLPLADGLEALAAGSALLTTRRGGIPEIAEGRAHIVDEPDADTLAGSLRQLITDDTYRHQLQQTAWNDYPFTATKMAADAATARMTALSDVSDS
jgi:UDP-glucose:(glucosyl)LPS alpha-1,2-glucosyltransferase